MSFSKCSAQDYSNWSLVKPCQAFQAKDVRQSEGAAMLLNMPFEVLLPIITLAASSSSRAKSAIRLVEIGRVCVLTHLLTDNNQLPTPENNFHSIINDENKFDTASEMYSMKFKQLWWRADGFSINQINRKVLSCLLAGPEEVCYAISSYIGTATERKDIDTNREPSTLLMTLVEKNENIVLMDEEGNYKDLLKVFYAVFKQTVKRFKHPNADEKIGAASLQALVNEPLAQQSFQRHMFNDMVNSFANVPIESLKMNYFLKAIEDISRVFGGSKVAIEYQFRKEIQKVHGQQLILLSEAFNREEEVKEIKKQLKDRYTSEFNAINSQIDTLCGSNFNGTIDAAYKEMRAAEDRKIAAEQIYFASMKTKQTDNEINQNDSCIAPLQSDLSTDQYQQALNDYKEQSQKYERLCKELSELAVWTSGVISSGKKMELEAKLSDSSLTVEAETQCAQIAKFYYQLSREINDGNKEQLSQDLAEVINGKDATTKKNPSNG